MNTSKTNSPSAISLGCLAAALALAWLVAGQDSAAVEPPLLQTSMNKPQPVEAAAETAVVKLKLRRSLLLRAKSDIRRTAIADPAICDVLPHSPREISLVPRAAGSTTVTIWFASAAHPTTSYSIQVEE